MPRNTTRELYVRRDAIAEIKWQNAPVIGAADLAQNELVLALDCFALTANNVSYAVLGDKFGYWQHFPTLDRDWGRVPVWGFANVLQSSCPEISVGERVYGYLPIGSHLRVQVEKASNTQFLDGSAHRVALAAFYRNYQRCRSISSYNRTQEGLHALLHPLSTTAFLLQQHLQSLRRAGQPLAPRNFVLCSASSKTALMTAFLLREAMQEGDQIIGLSSAQHLEFAQARGCFDRVLDYSQLSQLDANRATVVVDFSGNRSVLAQLHQHCVNLQHTLQIGLTHWQAEPTTALMPGPKPEVFFAPNHARDRINEWGASVFAARAGATWEKLLHWGATWLQIQKPSAISPEQCESAITQAWHDAVAGRTQPNVGCVMSLGASG